MSLQSLKDDFLNGKLDKWSYIDKMYDHHKLLIEYGKFIENTNISQISITTTKWLWSFEIRESNF